VEGVRRDVKAGEVFIADVHRGRVLVGVERGFHDQARACGGRAIRLTMA